MKVTFVLPLADWGGGCRVVAQYSHWLMQRGHDVVVVHRPDTAMRGRLSSALSRVFSTERWRFARSHLDALRIPQIRFSEYRPVNDGDIPDADVVFATYWSTAPEVLALSPAKGVKAYFLQHYEVAFVGADEDQVNETWTYPMHKIVVAPWLKEIADRKFGDSSAIVVPNGVDTQQFTAPPRRKSARPTVGFLFSHSSVKGSDIAIEAFELLRKDIPSLRLISFGQSWRGRLKNGPRLPKGTEHTVLPPQSMIRDLYAQCDVWVCASRSEGFGLPLLEAMACRTPVVSTPEGIAPELAEMGGLCLAPHDDPHGLACEIRRILELPADDWSNLSQKAHATANQFDVKDSARKFEMALEAIIAEHGTPACGSAAFNAEQRRPPERQVECGNANTV